MKMEPDSEFRKGELVEYTGTLTPGLRGRKGIVERTDRKGWVVVTFQGTLGEAKCAPFSLTRVEALA